MPLLPLPMAAVPVALVPIKLPYMVAFDELSICIPSQVFPETVLLSPATVPPIVGVAHVCKCIPLLPLAIAAEPIEVVPTKFPLMIGVLELIIKRPSSPFPDSVFPWPAAAPPTMALLEFSKRRPTYVLPIAAVPAALVPTLFPLTV